MANYEAFRAMYEGRNALLFHPTTAVITWMSNPAQPSFVWQIYHYDLEPMSSYFAVMHASELGAHPVQRGHGRSAGDQQQAGAVDESARARCRLQPRRLARVRARDKARLPLPDVATDLGPIDFPATVSAVHFIKLDLRDAAGQLLSTNFYWRAQPDRSRQPRRSEPNCPWSS